MDLPVLRLLFQWTTLRHWRRSFLSTLLLILSLGVGVGAFLGVRLANRAVTSGFALFTGALEGGSDWVLEGTGGLLDEDFLPLLRGSVDPLPVRFLPVLTTTAARMDEDGEDSEGFFAPQVEILGVDLSLLASMTRSEDREDEGASQTMSLSQGDSMPDLYRSVWVSRRLAEQSAWKPGGEVELVLGETPVSLKIQGIIPEGTFQIRAPSSMVLMDLLPLQEWTGLTGKISRVEVALPKGSLREGWLGQIRQKLEEDAGGRWEVQSPGEIQGGGEKMTRAFRYNLAVLSTLALLVGGYLILQAMEAAVSRRRKEIAVLRSLGVSSRCIRQAWCLEALVLSGMGVLAGWGLGWLMAQVLVGAVARTVNSLYFSTTVQAASWSWYEAWGGALLGWSVGLASGWWPAREAAATPPAEVLQHGALSRPVSPCAYRKWAWVSCCLLAGLLCALPPWKLEGGTTIPLAGYLAVAMLLGLATLAVRPVLPALSSVGRLLPSSLGGWLYPVSQFRRASGRHVLATAGMVVSVGMAAGMTQLVGSFETTLSAWIRNSLRADLYVATRGVANISSRTRISPEALEVLKSDSDVDLAEAGNLVRLPMGDSWCLLAGVDWEPGRWRETLLWLRQPSSDFWDALSDSASVPALINEAFLHRFGLARDGFMEIQTPLGERRLKVGGVFADYGSEQGSILLPRSAISEWFGDARALNLVVHLKPGRDAEQVRLRWLQAFPGLVVRTQSGLREDVLRIFHETFTVTRALKALGILVAVLGMGLALTGILLDRLHEMRVLRELGMTRRELAGAVAVEGAGMAFVGGGLGLILSSLLGTILIHVINRQSFGWTLQQAWPWKQWLGLWAGLVLVAIVVALLVGWRYSARVLSTSERDTI